MDIPPDTTDMDLTSVSSREQLISLLRSLRIRAGNPSYRDIEKKTGGRLSKTRVGQMLNGDRFPRREALTDFVLACGIPPEEVHPWVRAWERVAEAREVPRQTATAPRPTASNDPLGDVPSIGPAADLRPPMTPVRPTSILPLYYVCDESLSMAGSPIDALNASLVEMHQEIGANPILADKTRFCLISYSDEAQVLLPLSDLSTITSIPVLTATGGTRYRGVFELLRQTIDQDVTDLRADGHQVYRPAVFILSGSAPDDPGEWTAAYDRLTDSRWKARPNILAFGFGQADHGAIQQIANAGCFIGDEALGPVRALHEYAAALIRSVVITPRTSSDTVPRITADVIAEGSADGGPGLFLRFPDEVAGFTALPSALTIPHWLDGSDFQEKDLELGKTLGTGGQATVHDLRGQAVGYVYKRYLSSPRINGAALTRLVSLPHVLPTGERERLLRQTAWPLARVLDGSQVKGFIMLKAPAQFWFHVAAGRKRRKIRELQYLLFEPKPLWGDFQGIDANGRLAVSRHAAELFRLLHSKHLVVGDVSWANLLWSTSPPGVYLLDCDGVCEPGTMPVLPMAQTPDWDDPAQAPNGPDQDTDRFKLALLIARVLTRTPYIRPGERLDFVPGMPRRVVTAVSELFAAAGGPRGARPDAAQWIDALNDDGSMEFL